MFFLILGVSLAIIIAIVRFSMQYGISPMPSSRAVRRVLLEQFPIGEGRIAELGSGWGHLAFALARRFPECEVIGYEISPLPFFVAKVVQKLHPLPNLRFVRKDFFKEDLGTMDASVCYLYPGAMRRLAKKKFKPGSFLLSNTFSMPEWNKGKRVEVGDLLGSVVWQYHLK